MKAAERKLDIFPHIFPLEYFERMKKIAESVGACLSRMTNRSFTKRVE